MKQILTKLSLALLLTVSAGFAKAETKTSKVEKVATAVKAETAKKEQENKAKEEKAQSEKKTNDEKKKSQKTENLKTSAAIKPITTADDTIEAALESTYLNNTELKSQIKKLNATDEGIVQAKAGFRPRVTGNVSVGVTDTEYGGDSLKRGLSTTVEQKGRPNVNGGVELHQNLYQGGKTVAQLKRAESQVKADRARLTSKEQEIFFQATQAYLNIITKESEIDVYTSNVSYLSSSLKATQEKYNVGEETRTSVAQAESKLVEGEAQLDVAKAQLESLKANFKRITGRDPKKLTKPLQISKLLPESIDKAMQIATDNHPEILAARFDEEVAKFGIDDAGSGLLPSLDLKAAGTRQQTRNRSTFLNAAHNNYTERTRDTSTNLEARLTLTVPIYEQGSVRSQKRQAHEVRAEKRITIETTRNAVISKLVESWQNYLAAKANKESFKKQVDANKVSLDGTMEEMRVGTKILLDVLNAQSELLKAQLSLVRAEETYLLEGFKLLSHMGILTAKGLKLKVPYHDPNVHYNSTKNRI